MHISKVAILFQSSESVPFEFKDRHYSKMRETVPGIEVVHALTEQELIDKASDAEVLLTWGMYKPVQFCRNAKKLKWIHALSAGVEGLMVNEIANTEIIISNTKGIHGLPMADHTLAFILSFLREFPLYYQQQSNCYWKKHKTVEETINKTVGIIGLGSIGTEIARKCKFFDMRVVATKRNPIECQWIDHLYPLSELNALLEESDFVIVVVPLTPETEHFIGEKEFLSMKQSAYLINISRGKVINEQALINALNNGKIAGAGLDVFEEEPLPQDSPLWKMKNVVITPHTAADSPLYMDRAIDLFCENLNRFSSNEKLLNLVDRSTGY